MKAKPNRCRPELIGLVGVGLDGNDEEKRITRNDEILLVGGSEATHQHMQEVSVRVNESLRERGKKLREAEAAELLDLLRRAAERAGNRADPPGD
jgi:hypothetical protein